MDCSIRRWRCAIYRENDLTQIAITGTACNQRLRTTKRRMAWEICDGIEIEDDVGPLIGSLNAARGSRADAISARLRRAVLWAWSSGRLNRMSRVGRL
jgi:hypothetical protein